MMGGYGQWLTCASCRGPEGRGVTHLMHMRTMTPPDIRYVELRNTSELKGRQRPYDIDDFLVGYLAILHLTWVKIQSCRSMLETLPVEPRPQAPERSGQDGGPDSHHASQDKSQRHPAKMEGQG